MSQSVADTQRGAHVYTVGELLGGLRNLLEDRVGRLWVVGEVSNLHRARSGHVYFTLVDEVGQVRAALFRNAARRLSFEPEDGLEVLVYGDVTVYEARGDLQIIVREVEPRGRGALQVAFEQLRRRLEAEGLFDPARKRGIPRTPVRIGVVTSPTGAAIRDVLNVTGRRLPGVPIRIAPTRVQGDGAAEEIAEALAMLGAHGAVDVILLVRGGGSLEDLQAFNTEVIARAVVASPVPVIAGVGHEVDVTIADLAADARAPTPSAAAELAVPDRAVLRDRLFRDFQRLRRAGLATVEARSQALARERAALRVLAPRARVAARRSRLASAARALVAGGRAPAERARARLQLLSGRLDSLSPLAVLGRGYAFVQRERDGAIVRTADQVRPGERLRIRVARAEIAVRAENAEPVNE